MDLFISIRHVGRMIKIFKILELCRNIEKCSAYYVLGYIKIIYLHVKICWCLYTYIQDTEVKRKFKKISYDCLKAFENASTTFYDFHQTLMLLFTVSMHSPAYQHLGAVHKLRSMF